MPVRQLTRSKRKRVSDVLERRLDYKKLKTPEEWHQLADHWNWDDGWEPLQWITQQPLCDYGTALMIYWHASPIWYYQFKSRDDVSPDYGERATYDFVKEIEQRLLTGFYTSQKIRFDARNDDKDDLTVRNPKRPLQQSIPEQLEQASPGIVVPRENLVTIVIRPLNEKEERKAGRHLERGYRELLKLDQTLDSASEPKAIVEAIALAVETYKTTVLQETPVKYTDPILNLGWVWTEQLNRAYGWHWRAWDWESGAKIGMFSPDQQYASFPPNLIRYTLDVRTTPNKICELFEQLAEIKRTQDLAEAYSKGWIMRNPYFES